MRAEVCGVICEYDPFHSGHAYLLNAAREACGAEQTVCVMSGSFTQRGMPALLSPWARAEMALRCGADAVLSLPYTFAVREADAFTQGGVGILNALGCVTHIAFGCEPDAVPFVQPAAEILESGKAESAIRSGIAGGLSPAAATGQALADRLGIAPETLHAPNAALAIGYLRALIRLRSTVLPVIVPRTGSYHEAEAGASPSASALRGAILRGDWQSAERGMPPEAYAVMKKELAAGRVCPPEMFDGPVRYQLLMRTAQEWQEIPGIAEGLEERLIQCGKTARTRDEAIYLSATRRYTKGRIARALCHAVMNVTRGDLPAVPEYTRLLGFRESARPLLRKMRDSGFPVLTQIAGQPCAQTDARADELWSVLACQARGMTYSLAPVRVADG